MAANDAEGAKAGRVTAPGKVAADAQTTAVQTPTIGKAAGTGPAAPPAVPKDSQVIAAILKDMGVTDYEPRVVHQLLEFAYRYVTDVLNDAQVFSTYSHKKSVDSEDVRLAVQMQVDKMFTSPPPREVIAEIARQKNATPLPPIKSHAGPRLPADRYSLISSNFKMKSSAIHAASAASGGNITTPFRTGSNLVQARTTHNIGLAIRTVPSVGNAVKRKLDD